MSLGPIVRGEEALTLLSFFVGIRDALLHLVLPSHVIHLLVEFFIGRPYEVGLNRWFLRRREGGNASVKAVFHGFGKEFFNIFLAQTLQEILTFLFKLILFFPGVRHRYELFCVPYILAENPDLS